MKLFGRKHNTDSIEPKLNDYIVVIQWYDTMHITSENVCAHDKDGARYTIVSHYYRRDGLRNNMEYGIVNIIEL